MSENAGAKIDRVTPGERVMRRVKSRPPDLVSRTVVERGRFVGHRRDVHRGDLWTCSAGRVGGRQE
jgi:hypothetical protein